MALAVQAADGQSARQRGRALFQQKGCLQCHSIANAGGHKGPSLDGVGKRLKKEDLQRQIVEGGQVMPSFQEALTPEELRDLVEFLHRSTRIIAPPKRP